MDKLALFWAIVTILLILSFINNIQLRYENNKLKRAVDSFEMYYINKYSSNFTARDGIDGVAFCDKGFVVLWVGNDKVVPYSDYLETANHEYLHCKNPVTHFDK